MTEYLILFLIDQFLRRKSNLPTMPGPHNANATYLRTSEGTWVLVIKQEVFLGKFTLQSVSNHFRD